MALKSIISLLSYIIALTGIIPLFPWLSAVPRISLALGLLAGIWQERRGVWPLKNWMMNSAIVPVFLYYAVQYRSSNPLQPVVSVLAIMLAVRLAGVKTDRHYLQMHVLSLFCLAATSLYDLSPLFLLYLAVMLFLVAVSLVLLTFHGRDPDVRLRPGVMKKIIMAGLAMPLATLPLMVIMFPIIPRTQYPLWNFMGAPTGGVSGYSDRVEPGATSSLGVSRLLAFRAEMPRLDPKELYWRATVFNYIEGRRWSRIQAAPQESPVYSGRTITQIFYPEPGHRPVPGLDVPHSISLPRSRRTPDGIFEHRASGGKRLHYVVESSMSGVIEVKGKIASRFYMQLPDKIPKRIEVLAREILIAAPDDAGRLELLQQYFQNGGYRYSRTALPTGDDALEKFLFDTKQGHCEFFASSFALLARLSALPARIVAGYLGGDYNEMGGYYQVTEDQAHVWVEVFVTGRGWVRVDPSTFAINAGDVISGSQQGSSRFSWRLVMDSLDHVWNRSVVTFDFESQLEAARNAGNRFHGLTERMTPVTVMPWVVAAVVAGSLFFLLYTGRIQLFQSRDERILRKFLKLVEREAGVRTKDKNFGLFEIAKAAKSSKVKEFVDIYAGAVYRDRRLDDVEAEKLRKILMKLNSENLKE